MNLLGAKNYDPTGGAVSKVTTSLLAMTALDTTNLRIAFTIPAHGMVHVRMRCIHHGSTTIAQVMLGCLESATLRGRQIANIHLLQTAIATSMVRLDVDYTLTGLTPGAVSWDAAYGVEIIASASGAIKYGGPNDTTTNNGFGSFNFEIWDPQPLKIDLGGGVNTTQWNGTAVATPATAGIPDVNVKNIDNDAASASGTVTFPNATLASTTNITAGTITTATNVTTVNGLAANVITAASINADAITAAKIADGAIDAATFAAGAINAAAIAADAITAAKIADGAIDAATFAAGAINAAAIAADAITDAKVASDVTIASVTGAVGSVTGAVGSVTGAVGSVTGNVGGNVVGTVASVVGAVGSVTGLTASDVGAIKTKTDFLPSATAGAAGGVFIAGTNAATTITTALTTTFTGNLTGSVGSVTGLTASNLDATISSRATPAQVNTEADTAIADAALATAANLATVAGYLDTEIAAILSDTNAILIDTAEIGVAGAGLTNINLPNQTMDIIGNITGNLSGSVGSVTGLTAANLDVAVSTRLATAGYTAPDNASIAAILVDTGTTLDAAIADLPTNAELATALAAADDAVLAQVALVKAKTDNLPSDPADASVIAGALTALESHGDATWATATGFSTFVAATDEVIANVKKVNDITVDGTGTTADPWGPV